MERITLSNLHNTLRLFRHNAFSDIHFYRLTSRLIPLANHEELLDWNYMKPLREKLRELGDFVKKHEIRVDFHPDHFVVINSEKKEVLKNSIKTLKLHYQLLKGMGIDHEHRCVCMQAEIIRKRKNHWNVLSIIGCLFHIRYKR